MDVVLSKGACNILLALYCILSWRQLYIILISSITISKQDFMSRMIDPHRGHQMSATKFSIFSIFQSNLQGAKFVIFSIVQSYSCQILLCNLHGEQQQGQEHVTPVKRYHDVILSQQQLRGTCGVSRVVWHATQESYHYLLPQPSYPTTTVLYLNINLDKIQHKPLQARYCGPHLPSPVHVSYHGQAWVWCGPCPPRSNAHDNNIPSTNRPDSTTHQCTLNQTMIVGTSRAAAG